MDPDQINSMLNMVGVTKPAETFSMTNIMANLIFGTIGAVALMYGWKNKYPKPLAIGLALSIYTFFVPNVLLSYAIGIGLCALLYFWRD